MSENIITCPFLGMEDDPATNTTFPSLWNLCHKARPKAVPDFRHQQDYCLTEKHVYCPVFQRNESKPLPANLRVPPHQFGETSSFNWKIIPISIAMLALITFGGFKLFTSRQSLAQNGRLATSTVDPLLLANLQVPLETATPTPPLPTSQADSELAISIALTQTAAVLTQNAPSPTASLTATLTPTPTSTRRPAFTVAPPSKPKPKPKNTPASPPPVPTTGS